MLKRKSVLYLVFGLLLAASAQAHGPVPVPVDVVAQKLTNSVAMLERHHRVYRVAPDKLNHILADAAAPTSQKVRALIILAKKPEASAGKWYVHYKDKSDDLSMRYAVLYLGAMLGRQETRAAIIDVLQHRPDKGKQHFAEEARLLRGLVELTSADEFTRVTDELFKAKDHFFPYDKLKQVKLQSALYKGNAKQRSNAAYELLAMWNEAPELTEEALQFMIKQNDASPYLTSWRLNHPVLVYYLDRLGYTIQHTDGKAKFVKVTDPRVNQPASPDALAENLIRALASNRQPEFQQLLVAPEAYQLLSSLDESKVTGVEQSMQERRKNILESWQHLQRSATQRGIDLRQARFKSASYRVLVIIGGMQFTPIDITFSIANQEYRIRLVHSVLMDGQWHVAGKLHWL